MNLAATCSKHMELHAHRVLEKHLPYFNLVFLVTCVGIEGIEVGSVACVLLISRSLVAFCLDSLESCLRQSQGHARDQSR
jgi:hypothetical protein